MTSTATSVQRVAHLPGRKFDHLFFSTMALFMLVTVFVGFARTYYLAGVFHASLPSLIVHIHGAIFTAWIVLLVTQTSLVARRRVDIHRRLGIAGFLLAGLFVHVKPAAHGLMPYVIASQTVPIIAIAPMIVVGVGRLGAPPWLSKSIIAAYLTFFPVTINALRGLTSVHRDQLALMHSFAANEAQIFFKLRLPASTPYLFTAMKIAATASVVGAIIGNCPSARLTVWASNWLLARNTIPSTPAFCGQPF